MIRGMNADAAQRIESARQVCRFRSISDLGVRAQLTQHELQALANANALESIAGNRRQALWEAVVSAPDKGMLQEMPVEEESVQFPALREAESIAADYRSLGLTLGRHPVALLRPTLTKQRFLPAEVLNTFANGQFARGCGIVTVRQRPQTANGTIFVTLEDETGPVNVIVWPALVEKFRKELLGSRLLGVYGIWQTESGVHHLIAKRLVDMSLLLGRLTTYSRNFM